MKKTVFPVIIALLVVCSFAKCKSKTSEAKGNQGVVESQSPGIKSDPGISIFEAALNGQMSQVTGLLTEGYDVNKADEESRTALMYAAYNGHVEIMKRLLEKGALVNLRDTNGRTALMLAASGPYPAAVKLLLEKGADPDITDKEEHFTALMYAAAEGQMEVVKILLAFRADPSIKDADGDRAETFAAKNGHNNIVVLLRSFPAKREN